MESRNYSYQQNEIDIRDLFVALACGKNIILISMIVSVLIAVCYLLIKTPIYKVEVIIGKPHKSQLTELNMGEIFKVTPDDAFYSIKETLQNNKYLLEFYQNNKELFTGYDLNNENIEASLMNIAADWKVISLMDGKDKRDAISLSIEYPDAVKGYIVINKYIYFIIDKEKELFLNDFYKVKDAEIKELNQKIAANEIVYKIENKTKIEKLAEAVVIAKKIGLKKHYLLQGEKNINNSVAKLKAEINSQQTPLYYRGYEALQAERQMLLERKKEYFFIPGLIELERKLAYLNQLTPVRENISIVRWQQKAFEPINQIKPNKVHVVLLFIFIGFFVGIVLIIGKSLINYTKTYQQVSA